MGIHTIPSGSQSDPAESTKNYVDDRDRSLDSPVDRDRQGQKDPKIRSDPTLVLCKL
jgi:hypothetical protein